MNKKHLALAALLGLALTITALTMIRNDGQKPGSQIWEPPGPENDTIIHSPYGPVLDEWYNPYTGQYCELYWAGVVDCYNLSMVG